MRAQPDPAFEDLARHLSRPASIAAIAVLLINDHVWKGAGVLPGWLTGKLSDFAGLFFFPLLVAALVDPLLRQLSRRSQGTAADHVERGRQQVVLASAIVTGAAFTLVKTVPAARDLVEPWWGRVVLDPTDLVALVSLPACVFFASTDAARSDTGATHTLGLRRFFWPGSGSRRSRLRLRMSPSPGQFAVLVAAGLASMATSPPRPAEPPPPNAAPVSIAEAEIPPPPPDPETANRATAHQTPVAAADVPATCEVAVDVCERSDRGTFVVLSLRAPHAHSCEFQLLHAREDTTGGPVGADLLPAPAKVKPELPRTVAMSFLRPVAAGERTAPLRLVVDVEIEAGSEQPEAALLELGAACTAR